jgi:uncharacterized protein YjiS (DUF1127 family)
MPEAALPTNRFITETRHPSLASALLDAWREHRAARRLVRDLYRLPPERLLDIGFDPALIYGATQGSLRELPGDRYRGLTVTRPW